MTQPGNVHQLVGHLFRQEAGKMAAVLTRIFGLHNIEQAEDIVQDTLLQALSAWKFKGIPENPQAWLYTVAKNKTVDLLRTQKRRHEIENDISVLLKTEWTLVPTVKNHFLKNEIDDSQLRMIFACCHPSIPYESQIALTLKTLCGLSTSEIASGFLTNEETISKRIYRAKEKFKTENIQLEVPVNDLETRLDAVLKSLYLLFNEGYNSNSTNEIIREDLCSEAMRLCILLTENEITGQPQSFALLSLMCLQASRFDARLDDQGEIILLKDQDRSKWNSKLIGKGIEYLKQSQSKQGATEYHLEASIAACHALAEDFDATNWKYIYNVYCELSMIKPSPVIEMNKQCFGVCRDH
ncbi:MAG: sigma-70 family RNA polymerase sigma factor [Flammeovirgaceae bacterium]|nr:sigma-70 family RNA polymerase sigma factor [Flammeovirgaceae bacterium]